MPRIQPALLAIAALPLLSASAGAQHCGDGSLDARLDGFVEQAMARIPSVPGMAVGIACPGGAMVVRGYGLRNVELGLPVAATTRFYIASSTKSLFATAVAALAARGVLELDRPITSVFPGLAAREDGLFERVTLRRLLSHSAPYDNSTVNFRSAWTDRPSHEELVRLLLDYSTPREAPFRYSNGAYVVAAAVAEAVTGKTWQRLVADEVLFPLGLDGTPYAAEALSGEIAWPYLQDDGRFRRARMKTAATLDAAGGVFLSATDGARWVRAQLDAERSGARDAVADILRTTHEPEVAVNRSYAFFDRPSYGLGWYVGGYRNRTLLHHFGGYVGYHAHVSFMPEIDAGVVVFTNEGRDGAALPHIVAAWIYDVLLGREDADSVADARLDQAEQRAAQRVAGRASWRRELRAAADRPAFHGRDARAYVGRYESDRLGTIRVRVRDGRLEARWGAALGPLLPTGAQDEFLADFDPGVEPTPLSFVITDGRATELRWGERVWTRQP